MRHQCGFLICKMKTLDLRFTRVSPSSDTPGSGGCMRATVRQTLSATAQIPNILS